MDMGPLSKIRLQWTTEDGVKTMMIIIVDVSGSY